MTTVTEKADKMALSLRKDLPKHIQWCGLPLQPEVDMMFWLDAPMGQGTTRIVQAQLVRPGFKQLLQPLRDFDLETLGSDCVRLETLGREMVVVGNHVRRVSAFAEPNKIKFMIDVGGWEIAFVGTTGIMGRWDWLVNPKETDGIVYIQPVPIGQALPVRAAA